MKSMKKIQIGLAAAGLAALALSGCAGKTADKESTAQGNETAEKEEYRALDYVKLGDYTGVSINQVEEITQLDEDAQEMVIENYLLEKREEVPITERPVESGDFVAINYIGVSDGEVVDDGSGEELEIEVGAGYIADELEQALIGLKAGDTTEVTVSYEEDGSYDVTYTIDVLRVFEYSSFEMDDAFAKTQGYESADDLVNALIEQELAVYNAQYLQQAWQDGIDIVIQNSTCDGYPQGLYDQIREQMNADYETYWGITLEEAFENDEEQIDEIVREDLETRLIVEAIAEQEGITVSSEEIESYCQKMIDNEYYESMEELEGYYTEDALAYETLYEKVQEFIYSNADITYISEEEYFEDFGDMEDDYEEFEDMEDDYEDPGDMEGDYEEFSDEEPEEISEEESDV